MGIGRLKHWYTSVRYVQVSKLSNQRKTKQQCYMKMSTGDVIRNGISVPDVISVEGNASRIIPT